MRSMYEPTMIANVLARITQNYGLIINRLCTCAISEADKMNTMAAIRELDQAIAVLSNGDLDDDQKGALGASAKRLEERRAAYASMIEDYQIREKIDGVFSDLTLYHPDRVNRR